MKLGLKLGDMVSFDENGYSQRGLVVDVVRTAETLAEPLYVPPRHSCFASPSRLCET